ncbi:hypothetical protein I551_1145 [Mycobacterium ulcerans str. Harvey]|uniref:Uncharacterized protein n=1 Tax=Mycobacterium ulcerans str. Harvey TaxID=1299332 RepID=A0ABP3AN99_MYCUL|nr:hypothetical protein I551_1145 [Mycobacterium ulcerans str. Harvey]
MATRTTAALGCSLLVLYLLTMATGQPLTVALIGVVVTMIAARSVDDPDSRQQQITMASPWRCCRYARRCRSAWPRCSRRT